MLVPDSRRFGQVDPAVITAAVPEPPVPAGSMTAYYLMAVAAGVTVWLITRWLSKRS